MVKEQAVEASVESTTAVKAGSPTRAMRSSPTKQPGANTQQALPTIITVGASKTEDTKAAEQPAERRDAEATSFVQANTPKHANKTGGPAGGARDDPSPPPTGGRIIGGQGDERKEESGNAHFPRQQLMQPGRQAHMQVQFAPPPYDGQGTRRTSGAYVRAPYHGQRPHYPAPPGTGGASHRGPPQYPPPPQFQGRHPPPEFYNQGRFQGVVPAQYRSLPNASVQPYGRAGPPTSYARPEFNETQQYGYQTRYVEQSGAGTGAFSRAVSHSFDRSSHPEGRMPQNMGPAYYHEPERRPSLDATGSVADDDSWNQLKHVTSVDEDAMNARLSKTGRLSTPTEEKQVRSASSSLTNSPVDGKDGAKPAMPAETKLTSLDSLSSVASIQEKIQTAKGDTPTEANGERLSPGSASAAESLDLLKCHSGSSGLLQGFPGGHRRDASLTSVHIPEEDHASKEKRALEDAGADQSQAKRRRSDVKGSPLSISCSPPGSPTALKDKKVDVVEKSGVSANLRDPNHRLTASPGVAFQPPSYTYSIESAPSRERGGYPPLPPRPSSSSSTTAPGVEHHNPRELGQSLPSWDIHGQDSFGGGSTGPIMPNFSFATHDYPMLAQSGSNLGLHDGKFGGPSSQVGLHQHGPGMHPPFAESRNQSFEGGHYHGSFSRSESMDMGYPPAPSSNGPPGHYKGQFPPHAPSWGSVGSTTAGFHGGPVPSRAVRFREDPRMPPGSMMRNFSEDGSRASPPGPPSAFPMPPRDFSAPSNQNLHRRAPPAPVYLMSSRTPMTQNLPIDPGLLAKQNPGIYGWSKEDDDSLTEVMKKYKTPRNWEPIAKELARGKSAKECHERWIRYLKPGVRKGQWTDQEDAVVVEAVTSSTEQPFTRWSDLAQRLPGRVGKQIRDRWVNHLNPHINHLPFSREDDLCLWEGHKVCGKRWVEISTRFFNSSRSENHIKNRWYSASFKKFISNEFGSEAYGHAQKGKSPKGKGKGSARE